MGLATAEATRAVTTTESLMANGRADRKKGSKIRRAETVLKMARTTAGAESATLPDI